MLWGQFDLGISITKPRSSSLQFDIILLLLLLLRVYDVHLLQIALNALFEYSSIDVHLHLRLAESRVGGLDCSESEIGVHGFFFGFFNGLERLSSWSPRLVKMADDLVHKLLHLLLLVYK